MKIAITTFTVALIACFSAWATPPPHSAKAQLPEQASPRAKPPSKTMLIIPPPPIPPPPVIPPPPPTILPPILVSFTSGQTSPTASQEEAQAAVEAATETVRAKLANSSNISIITITGKRLSLRTTKLPPTGRAGDLEIIRWGFADRRGHKIGNGNALCRWANATRQLCWGEIRLPLGKLVIIGSSQTRILGEYAVIGGTGVYTFKQGLIAFRQLSVNKYAIRVLLA